MKKQSQSNSKVMGRCAPGPRMTKAAAFLIAVALSIPVFILLTLADLLFL
jgi:hypothetical protein